MVCPLLTAGMMTLDSGDLDICYCVRNVCNLQVECIRPCNKVNALVKYR